jgi:hypothetical protein
MRATSNPVTIACATSRPIFCRFCRSTRCSETAGANGFRPRLLLLGDLGRSGVLRLLLLSGIAS